MMFVLALTAEYVQIRGILVVCKNRTTDPGLDKEPSDYYDH